MALTVLMFAVVSLSSCKGEDDKRGAVPIDTVIAAEQTPIATQESAPTLPPLPEAVVAPGEIAAYTESPIESESAQASPDGVTRVAESSNALGVLPEIGDTLTPQSTSTPSNTADALPQTEANANRSDAIAQEKPESLESEALQRQESYALDSPPQPEAYGDGNLALPQNANTADPRIATIIASALTSLGILGVVAKFRAHKK